MAGFGQGFIDGLQAGAGTVNAIMRGRDLRRKADMEQREYEEQRELKDGRKAAVTDAIAAGTTPARAGEEGPVPEKRAPIWQSLDSAAQQRLQKGDVDGYEAMTQKSIALKTMHFGTKLNQAALTGDPSAIASVMNEMSPDYKFDAKLDERTGEVVGTVAGPEGRTIPLSFKSVPDMVQATRAFATQGNVAATFQEQAKQRAEMALKQAQTENQRAQTGQHQAQTGFIKANTDTEVAMRPLKVEETEAGIGLKGAQTVNQLADASRSAQGNKTEMQRNYEFLKTAIGEEAANAFVTGKGDRSKSREQAIIDVSKALASATPGPGQDPLTAEEATKRAIQIVDGAAQAGGTARVGSGAGMRAPGAAAPAAPTGRGMGGKVKAPDMDPAESRAAAEIKAAFKAGKLSREDATKQLQALGFQ